MIQSTLTEIPPTMLPVEPVQRPGRRVAIWSWLFVLAQIGTLAGCMAIASSPWFLRHDDYPWLGETIGYSLQARGQNCDIVIYGDSTALVGLDPAIIQARTSMKTCNIAETLPVQAVVGSYYPVDQYLAHNARPRILLTMLSPLWFHTEQAPMEGYFPEGIEYALLYDNHAFLWKGFARKPLWLADFSIWAGRSLFMDALFRLHLTHAKDTPLERIPRAQRAGRWQYDLHPQTECVKEHLPDWATQSERAQSIAAFRQRYSTDRTRVVIDASPLADCIANQPQLRAGVGGMNENAIQFLPVGNFNNGDMHLAPAGSRLISEQVADQILSLIQRPSEH